MSRVNAGKFGLSLAHIRDLRNSLIKWGNPTDPHEGDKEVIDLWFVDTDVLYSYVDAASGNHLSDWSSLYALGDSKQSSSREASAHENDKALMDAIAIAVTYFLFGRLRNTLSVQSRRFLITPEHDRELDAIAMAVSFEAQQQVPHDMAALTAHYSALAKVESVDQLTDKIDSIFTLLRERSSLGKAYRALDLRRRVLDTMQGVAIFPDENPRSAFILKLDNTFDKRVKSLACEAFDIFMGSLISKDHHLEQLKSLKYAVFDFHSPDKRLREYIDHISMRYHQGSIHVGGKSFKAKTNDDHYLTIYSKIAAREVSDVYSFARLVALAEILNQQHPQDGREWRINLLTGSQMERSLRDKWREQNAMVDKIRLVHPLNAMSIDGFAQPDERGDQLDEDERMDAPGAYALRVLKQDDFPGDVDAFFTDLLRLLSAVTVSHAPNRERWLRSLRMSLDGQGLASRSAYLRAVRDAISRDFVATFSQINQIPPNKRGRLPQVSLPALTLPMSDVDPSPAQSYVMQLHNNSSGTSPLPLPISDLLRADKTGYSALLCAGLGYLAQGQNLLPLAESAASTAVVFATTCSDDESHFDQYPEGNEACYLAAFVSRMQVDGSAVVRHDAEDWLQRHRALMCCAIDILGKWDKSEIGLRSVVANHDISDVTLADLVRIRYEAEQLAANVFGHLIDRMDQVDIQLLPDQTPVECFDFARDIVNRLDRLSPFKLKPQYVAEVAFVNAQLLASIVQLWLCICSDNKISTEALSEYEGWITAWLRQQPGKTLAPGSMLVRVLIEIFRLRTAKNYWQQSEDKRIKLISQLDNMDFACLDKLRRPLFKKMLSVGELTTPIRSFFGNANASG
ncbi:MAG: hypothetical protein KJ558_01875 [Gammaproteobacteria bacterium]|nr:hypothetical protein [Gammaproteobacteria bacterium]MBU1653579.1 hypothetical protein [Gammaproteobacteria bacterium]MBU1962026.1 hypothetical protein [Gammaproteobacteria bacterium]